MVKETKGRHAVLVVEDEQEAVDEMQDLLRSLGHDPIAVPSQEEAMELLETREFCFVMLDLQILTTPGSINPRVEAGKTLLRKIRERFPARNQEDHHHLQILVMSGRAKDTPDVVQCLQVGADDFITKPLHESVPSPSVKIEECLRKSHRTNHADCSKLLDLARREPVAHRALTPMRGLQLSITGEAQGKRTGITIGGKTLFLPDAQFLLLMRIVAGRVRDGQGWVHKHDLGSKDEQGFKGISNLNSVLRGFLPPNVPCYENDLKGRYRLHHEITLGEIGHEWLARHTLKEVQGLSAEMERLR